MSTAYTDAFIIRLARGVEHGLLDEQHAEPDWITPERAWGGQLLPDLFGDSCLVAEALAWSKSVPTAPNEFRWWTADGAIENHEQEALRLLPRVQERLRDSGVRDDAFLDNMQHLLRTPAIEIAEKFMRESAGNILALSGEPGTGRTFCGYAQMAQCHPPLRSYFVRALWSCYSLVDTFNRPQTC